MSSDLRFFNILSKLEKERLISANQNAIARGLLPNSKLDKDLFKPKPRLYLSIDELNAQCMAYLTQNENHIWVWRDSFKTLLNGLYKYVYFNNAFYVYRLGDKALDKLFKHCSLACGMPVEMSGSLLVDNGRMLEITNDSGHYPSNEASFLFFINKLKQLYPNIVDSFDINEQRTYTCLSQTCQENKRPSISI